MTEIKNYSYESVLKNFITDYIAEKRELGFIYNAEAYNLKRFDEYWNSKGYEDVVVTSDRFNSWICCFPGEGKSSQSGRISSLRGLLLYMRTRGVNCDIPIVKISCTRPDVHILSKNEIKELFSVIDSYVPEGINQENFRIAKEYPVMFRLFYCCGMRNNEVCSLKLSDVDFEKGVISIFDGKNNKDRLVYLSDDMTELMRKYKSYLKLNVDSSNIWLFPGRIIDKHIHKTTIDRVFNKFWNRTNASLHCDRKPTPHCLRHTFVVNRINQWIADGYDINVLLPYLSKYLGHKDFNETFYYYHLVDDAFKIVKQKDTVAENVIPEVRRI